MSPQGEFVSDEALGRAVGLQLFSVPTSDPACADEPPHSVLMRVFQFDPGAERDVHGRTQCEHQAVGVRVGQRVGRYHQRRKDQLRAKGVRAVVRAAQVRVCSSQKRVHGPAQVTAAFKHVFGLQGGVKRARFKRPVVQYAPAFPSSWISSQRVTVGADVQTSRGHAHPANEPAG